MYNSSLNHSPQIKCGNSVVYPTYSIKCHKEIYICQAWNTNINCSSLKWNRHPYQNFQWGLLKITSLIQRPIIFNLSANLFSYTVQIYFSTIHFSSSFYYPPSLCQHYLSLHATRLTNYSTSIQILWPSDECLSPLVVDFLIDRCKRL